MAAARASRKLLRALAAQLPPAARLGLGPPPQLHAPRGLHALAAAGERGGWGAVGIRGDGRTEEGSGRPTTSNRSSATSTSAVATATAGWALGGRARPLSTGAEARLSRKLQADVTWKELKVPSHFEGKLFKLGIKAPTEVQAAAIPHLMAGKNLLLQWVTGSGKTLSYLLPAFSKIDREEDTLQLLIVVPTRELAVQVCNVAQGLTRFGSKDWKRKPITVHQFSGPATKAVVERLTRNPPMHVLVATPPVAKILLEKKLLDLKHVSTFVLDEADKLFDPELEQYTTKILDMVKVQETANRKYMSQPSTPTARNALPIVQHVYCSATITDGVRSVAKRYLNQREKCQDAAEGEAPRMPTILKHYFVDTPPETTPIEMISKLHAAVKPVGASLIFTKDVVEANQVVEVLRKKKFNPAILTAHIPKERKARAALLRKVARNSVNMLITTEMGSRGLDLPKLSMCVNLEPPPTERHYLHRAGRLGRIHTNETHIRKGTVVTIVSNEEERLNLDKQAGHLNLPLVQVSTVLMGNERSVDCSRASTQASLCQGELRWEGKGAGADEEADDENNDNGDSISGDINDHRAAATGA